MIDLQERFSERKNFFNRLVLVYILFGILFGFVIYNTYSLQVSSFSDYEIAALKNKSREILVQPKRGIIYDRNGKILVNNEPSYNLIFKPSQVTNLNELINEINVLKIYKKNILIINSDKDSRVEDNYIQKVFYIEFKKNFFFFLKKLLKKKLNISKMYLSQK